MAGENDGVRGTIRTWLINVSCFLIVVSTVWLTEILMTRFLGADFVLDLLVTVGTVALFWWVKWTLRF